MPGTDCFSKAIPANQIKNGNAVVMPRMNGDYEVVENTNIPNLDNLDAWENRLTTRFDDPSYYYGN